MAAAEVFRRCEVLQSELRKQIAKANEVKGKIDTIKGVHRDGESDNAMYERRLETAKERQESLAERVEKLRKLVGKTTTRDLSVKERAFIDEVKTLESNISKPEDDYKTALVTGNESKKLWRRLESVKELKADLIADAEGLQKAGGEAPTTAAAGNGSETRIPQDIRRTKLQHIQSLLSRETALVEAVTARLEKLQTSL
jgi:nucleoporin NUP82